MTDRHNGILVVCLNPTFQRTMVFEHFWEGEVNRCSQHYIDASGKGANVVRVVTQLGGQARLLSHLGGSKLQEMLDLLDSEHIQTVWTDSHSPIRTCTTVINRERATTTELVEEPEPVGTGTDAAIRALYTRELSQAGIVVFSGTRAKGYTPGLYPDFVREAKALGKCVILDVKGSDLTDSLVFRPDVIKPNLSEFAATFMSGQVVKEQDGSSELKDTVTTIMEQVYGTYGISTVLTRGSHSVWLFDSEGFCELPVEKVEAVNTIGCGDAVTGGMAHALSQGATLRQAVGLGLVCGGKNAQYLRLGILPR